MSIEMPEATILAHQMQSELPGRTVAGFELRDSESLQRMGFVDKDPAVFARLVGRVVEAVTSRGNTILVKLDDSQNLILAPEYGGEILFHSDTGALPTKYHFRLDFAGGAVLTVRIVTMGCINGRDDEELEGHYMMRRDFFSGLPQPDDERLSPEVFEELLAAANRQLKPVLVGKDAIVVGLSNSAFQDIIYRAHLHPKRRASELSPEERRALYDSMRLVVTERLRLGGKSSFRDLYGVRGRYEPAMGPGMRGKTCPACGSPVQKLKHGGGDVFVCVVCQPETT